MINGGTFTNEGTVDDQVDLTFLVPNILPCTTSGGSFNNSGTFTKSGGTGTTLFATQNLCGPLSFNNTGTVNVNSGTLGLQDGGSSTGGSFSVAAGSTLDFSGGAYTLDGSSSVTGAGTAPASVAPRSPLLPVPSNHRQYNRLWRLSDLQQQRQHRHLHPERGRAGESNLGGSASCTIFGQVNVSGAATLGGTLSVELTNGCGSPSSTQSFQVMRHASHSGTFASVNTPTVNGRPMPVSYFPTNVTVGSTPQAKDLTVSTDRDPVIHAHLQLEHQEEC